MRKVDKQMSIKNKSYHIYNLKKLNSKKINLNNSVIFYKNWNAKIHNMIGDYNG